ncbi:MAG: L-lactate permease [Chloroflexi bacterium]|nr:L-lactate permease [Chloroflexota bacterium]
MAGPDLTLANWLLAAVPVALLMVAIFFAGWSAPRAGATAWALALALAFLVFGAASDHVAIASAKGLSLAVFVLTIVWTSVYMFNLVDRLNGIDAIGRAMARLSEDRLAQALLIGWGFASFVQGVTGFGVPIAVAAPVLIMLGFSPARAAGMALVGHGWAVTFGSMGSSYYTIQLVTGIEGHVIAPHMALLFAPVIIASGALVAHIYGGFGAVRRSLPLVIVAGSVMAAGMYVLAEVDAPQIASSVPAILGMATMALLARTRLLVSEQGRVVPAAPEEAEGANPMPFWLAFLPYTLLISLSVIAQIGPIKEASSGLRWALDYPGFVTGEGFVVAAVSDYAPIRLLNHPAPLIVISLIISTALYVATSRWRRGVAAEAFRLTYSQCLATSIGVATMAMMAVVMADSGMTVLLARGLADASGPVFPVVSPFIGMLGAFMSGSNTNSNVMFGLLQLETARALDIGPVTISSIQSVGASVGSAMAPAKVLVGAAVVGLSGSERDIFRIVTPYILLLVLLAGIEAWIVVELLTGLSR